MVIVKVALPVPREFVALIVTVKVPVAVGVPEITPVEVFTVSVNPGPPAVAQVGLSELIVGLALTVITSVC